MEFESPIRGRDGSTYIKIHAIENCSVDFISSDSIPKPGNIESLHVYVAQLAKDFEIYSIKWIKPPIFSIDFIKNLSHNWKYESHPHPVYQANMKTLNVRQVWCPEQIQIIRNKYTLHWTLISVEYKSDAVPSGEDDFAAIPYCDDLSIAAIIKSPRARIIQKIRIARIRAAAAKLKLNTLTDSYYTKYGITEGLHKESDLSSEIDSNSESSAKK
jgi:hypothetical protein